MSFKHKISEHDIKHINIYLNMIFLHNIHTLIWKDACYLCWTWHVWPFSFYFLFLPITVIMAAYVMYVYESYNNVSQNNLLHYPYETESMQVKTNCCGVHGSFGRVGSEPSNEGELGNIISQTGGGQRFVGVCHCPSQTKTWA